MAAVLAGGTEAGLSFESAAVLWGMRDDREGPIEISVPTSRRVRQRGLIAHRRRPLIEDLTRHQGIPVTTPARTLIDLATRLRPGELDAAVNEADKLDLVDPEALRQIVSERNGLPGVARLRRLLGQETFSLTDSELERRFLPLARRAGLPPPLTQEHLHGLRVDLYWPELALVVETDGLRYHRTPAQQGRDRLRDQILTAAGLAVLRFTHRQVRYEAGSVVATLAKVAARLRRQA